MVVGLDPSTTLGWGVVVVGKENNWVPRLHSSGVLDLHRGKHESIGMQMVKLENFLAKLFMKLVDEFGMKKFLLVFEEVRFHVTGIDAAHSYGEITGEITRMCEQWKVPYTSTNTSHARKLATGKGNYTKAEVAELLSERYGVDFVQKRIEIKFPKGKPVKKRKMKCPSCKKKVELTKLGKCPRCSRELDKDGYDETDAIVLADSFIREMGWADPVSAD